MYKVISNNPFINGVFVVDYCTLFDKLAEKYQKKGYTTHITLFHLKVTLNNKTIYTFTAERIVCHTHGELLSYVH